MIYVLIALLVIAIGVIGYLVYDRNKKAPEREVEKQKVELIQREVKHYNHVFNYNTTKAYGGE